MSFDPSLAFVGCRHCDTSTVPEPLGDGRYFCAVCSKVTEFRPVADAGKAGSLPRSLRRRVSAPAGAFLALLLAVMPAEAQSKLAGTFQIPSCGDRPGWASFALLIDTQDFSTAAACSRTTGLRWVLYLTGNIYQPVDAHVVAVKARADAAGLSPYLLAVTDHEEWYESTLGGAWSVGHLDPTRDVDIWGITEIVHAWTSARTAAIKRLWPGLPVAWITSLVNDDRRFGAFLWRPLPAGIDVIALEAYVPAWGTWDTTAGLHLAHALRTRREPIALITQGFRWQDAGGNWGRGPTEDGMRGLESVLGHPRVIASWSFCHDGVLWSVVECLAQLPEWRSRYERAIGVR